jgi:predicted ATPase/DNA-binding XRE family transcriptional regulator
MLGMKTGAPSTFGTQLKALREAAGFTQEELATIAGLSVHAVRALERGQRRRPQVDTVRALCAALDLTDAARDHLVITARTAHPGGVADEPDAPTLPLPLTQLLGRQEDLDVLGRWLAHRHVRLITLTGPGGAGKTRLALEIARRAATEGAARVRFVPLEAIRDVAFVAPAIAEALGLLDTTAADLPRRARASCEGAPTLLLLDNFEQVLDAAPLVTELLSSVTALRVLVTSRAPLRVRGEREYTIGPLALDIGNPDEAAGNVSRSPAVQLFVDRVRDVQPGFRLTSANASTITAICRRLDALPLALELAAPWLKTLSPEALLQGLARDAPLEAVAPRDLPERQRTINATVAWSYQLLAPSAQRAFRRLSVLPGRFPIEATAAVVTGRATPSRDEVLGVTADLVDKSLLLQPETALAAPPRPLYRMLETVRAYAAVELDTRGERDDAMEGLTRYSIEEAGLAARGLVGHGQGEWLDRVRDDLDTHRAAMRWLIEQRRLSDATKIALGLVIFWVIRGLSAEGLDWFQKILAVGPLPAAIECRVLTGAGTLLYTQGRLDRSRAAVTRALALNPGGGDAEWVPQAELIHGHVEHAVGNEAAAREHFTQCVAASGRVETDWRLGNALSGLAWVAAATGDLEAAERLLGESVAALSEAGQWFQLLPLYLRAVLAVRRGNPDEALARGRESLVHVRALHDSFALVYALVPLASAAMLKGDHAWAARVLGARDAITERTGVTAVDQSVDDLQQSVERETRDRLGLDRWARAHAAGRTASIDMLLADIDAHLG